MLVLFDQGAPRGVARALRGHTVVTAKAKGWDRLTNGVLLKVAEEAAVDLLLTTDRVSAISKTSRTGRLPSSFWPAPRDGHAYDCIWNVSLPWWTRPCRAATPRLISRSVKRAHPASTQALQPAGA